MNHAEYKRMVPGADTAVLFVHGILGTPNHFRDLIPLVQPVPEKWSVHNVLLDGHGGSADDFSRTSMVRWKNQVKQSFEDLTQKHDRVVVVAHSMGTLFAIQLAIQHPEKIPFLFLLGVPLRPHMRFGMMRDCVRMAFGTLPRDSVLWQATSVTATKQIWKYIRWVPRYLELFKEIGITERMINKLQVPCTAYQSRKDELVSNLTYRVLNKTDVMKVHQLENSTHFYYTPIDMELICTDFRHQLMKKSHD